MSKPSTLKTSLVSGGALGFRPELPGSTPSAGGAGRKNPYSQGNKGTRLMSKSGPLPPTKKKEEVGLLSSGMPDFSALPAPAIPKDTERRQQNVMLTKLVQRLPHTVREPVTSILTMAFDQSSQAQHKIDNQNLELITIRGELKKKTKQMEQLNNSCDIYRDRLKVMENKLRSLSDDIESRQKITTQNKRHMARMSATNRMLINSLEALNEELPEGAAGDDASMASSRRGEIKNMALADILKSTSRPNSPKSAKLPPPPVHTEMSVDNSVLRGGLSPEMSAVLTRVAGEKAARPLGQNAANEKLRESLLRVAREHYRYVKKSETLERTVRELRDTLAQTEANSRRFKLELDEFRDASIHDAGDETLAQTRYKKEASLSIANKMQKLSSYHDLDDRFKFQMFHRNAMDPVEAVVSMRRLLAYVAGAPGGASEKAMGNYFAHDNVCRIFEVEAVAISIALDGGDGITKYFSREGGPHIHVDIDMSITTEVMRTCDSQRINNIQRTYTYNAEIDSCPHVTTEKILCVPIVDKAREEVIGAFCLFNKLNDHIFTDADDVFATCYAEQIGNWFTASLVQERICQRVETLTHLMHTPEELLKAVPEPNTAAAKRDMSVKEILHTMEQVAAEGLKCAKVRAFVRNGRATKAQDLQGNPSDLIMLDPKTVNSKIDMSWAAVETMRVGTKSGIAGHVNNTKRLHLLTDTFHDGHFNPEVDLDPVGSIMVCVPILDFSTNDVIGILQLVATSASPTMSKQAGNDGQVLFDQAAEWLAYVMSTPLSYLLKGIGAPALKPAKAPRRFTSVIRHGITEVMVSAENAHDREGSIAGSGPPSPTGSGLALDVQNLTPSSRRMSISGRSVVKSLTPVGAAEQENDSLKQKLSAANKEILHLRSMSTPHMAGTDISRDGTVFAEELEDEIAEKTKQLAARDETIIGLQAQLAELSKTLSDTSTAANEEKKVGNAFKEGLEALELENKALVLDVEKLKAEVVRTQSELQKTQQTADAHQEALRRAQEAMASGDEGSAALREQLGADIARLESMLKQEQEEKNALAVQASSIKEVADANKSQLDATNTNLKDMRAAHGRSEAEVVSLKEQITKFQDSITKKDNLLAILQEQVVKLASEQISKIDQSVVDATKAQREADMRALVEAQALADAASKADEAAAEAAATAAANAASAAVLGDVAVWEQYTDDTGRQYYFNTVTEETSWDRPPSSQLRSPTPGTGAVDAGGSSGSALVRVGNFVQYFDDANHPFWVNEVTGESQWELPPGAAEAMGSPAVAGDSATAGDYAIEL